MHQSGRTIIMARRWPTQSMGPPENGRKAALRPSSDTPAADVHLVLAVSAQIMDRFRLAGPAMLMLQVRVAGAAVSAALALRLMVSWRAFSDAPTPRAHIPASALSYYAVPFHWAG